MISFIKMHGIGNDFVVIDERGKIRIPEERKPDFAKYVCRRRFSLGADGVLFLTPSESMNVKMSMYNPDGSKAETCVNGLRCAAFALYEIDRMKGIGKIGIETLAGNVKTSVERVSDNLAKVELEILGIRKYLGKKSLEVLGRKFDYHEVNVGNPHAVIFLDEPVEHFPVEDIGHKIEYLKRFQPDRINTEFVNVRENEREKYLFMRVHERGACETLGCGSGSIAAVIAGCESGYLEKNSWVKVKQLGGSLEILYGDKLLLKGPAEISYRGRLNLE